MVIMIIIESVFHLNRKKREKVFVILMFGSVCQRERARVCVCVCDGVLSLWFFHGRFGGVPM